MVYSDTIYFRRCHSVTANFQRVTEVQRIYFRRCHSVTANFQSNITEVQRIYFRRCHSVTANFQSNITEVQRIYFRRCYGVTGNLGETLFTHRTSVVIYLFVSFRLFQSLLCRHAGLRVDTIMTYLVNRYTTILPKTFIRFENCCH